MLCDGNSSIEYFSIIKSIIVLIYIKLSIFKFIIIIYLKNKSVIFFIYSIISISTIKIYSIIFPSIITIAFFSTVNTFPKYLIRCFYNKFIKMSSYIHKSINMITILKYKFYFCSKYIFLI